ncbi:MAG: hypothetical protein NTY46_03960 [Candidatus Sumerlaeota bacterium]|nr:hypothetical protein [Candidatus Sumerlaeota bacterium]
MVQKKFLLRINQDLWNELERWANMELRSVNGQIEFLLRDAVQRRRRVDRVNPMSMPVKDQSSMK